MVISCVKLDASTLKAVQEVMAKLCLVEQVPLPGNMATEIPPFVTLATCATITVKEKPALLVVLVGLPGLLNSDLGKVHRDAAPRAGVFHNTTA